MGEPRLEGSIIWILGGSLHRGFISPVSMTTLYLQQCAQCDGWVARAVQGSGREALQADGSVLLWDDFDEDALVEEGGEVLHAPEWREG